EHHANFGSAPALLIRTNGGDAEDLKIVRTPLAATACTHWRDVGPHHPCGFMLGFAVRRACLTSLQRDASCSAILRRPRRSEDQHTIAFDEEAYSLSLDEGFEFETDTLRFSYSSMTTPSKVWDYDLAARTRTLRKRQEIPSGHDPGAYVTRRALAKAPDGE